MWKRFVFCFSLCVCLFIFLKQMINSGMDFLFVDVYGNHEASAEGKTRNQRETSCP